jgi:hypothetical protein
MWNRRIFGKLQPCALRMATATSPATQVVSEPDALSACPRAETGADADWAGSSTMSQWLCVATHHACATHSKTMQVNRPQRRARNRAAEATGLVPPGTSRTALADWAKPKPSALTRPAADRRQGGPGRGAWAQDKAEIGRCASLPIVVPLPLRRPAPDAVLTALADSPEASPAPAWQRDKPGQAPQRAPST